MLIKRAFYFVFIAFTLVLNAQEIEILSDFNAFDLPIDFEKLKRSYTIHTPQSFDYYSNSNPRREELSKIFIFNPFFRKGQREVVESLPKEKLILFVWEPYLLSPKFYDAYSKVFTWDDRLIDNEKFFRFNYPNLMPFSENSTPFQARKLCTIVTLNWNEYRQNLFHFFEKNHPTDLECYGRPPSSMKNASMYKGQIPGGPVSKEKIETLKNYRFAICFEHTVGLDGYITEKIFACFSAGCIPIYWGAPNIGKYIPLSCYIDYRDYKTDEELYTFLSSMTKEQYNKYIDAIQSYLKSDQAQVFAPKHFEEILCKAISD